jgi:hypothetical protein
VNKNVVENNERFIEHGNNVMFPKIGFVFHKSFVNRFKGMTFIQARRTMKNWYSHAEKDEIIHYLKKCGVIVPPVKEFKK